MKNRKKTVLITGAGQGIGQAIAYRFASDKANVVIASFWTKFRNPQNHERLPSGP